MMDIYLNKSKKQGNFTVVTVVFKIADHNTFHNIAGQSFLEDYMTNDEKMHTSVALVVDPSSRRKCFPLFSPAARIIAYKSNIH